MLCILRGADAAERSTEGFRSFTPTLLGPDKQAAFAIARVPESSSLRSLQLRRFVRSGRVHSLASGAPLARLAPSLAWYY